MQQLKNTYSGKKVLITGHTGFKGSWLTFILHLWGAEIKGYALAPDEGQKLYGQLGIDTLADSEVADIRDAEKLKKTILDFQPDFIFHLAAQSLVLKGYEHPKQTVETNVMGTVNLLDAVRQLEKKCTVIVVSTDKVYQNKEHGSLFDENDPLGGSDPYSSSKAAADLITQSYSISYFHADSYDQHQKAIGIVRCGNVIGGGDGSKNRIVPDFIRALQKNETIQLRNPNAIRPWIHILDCLTGYLILGQKMDENPVGFSGAFNFGPDNNTVFTVEQLCAKMIACIGTGNYETVQNKDQRYEAQLLRLNAIKAKEKLGWMATLTIDEAILLTVDWYKQAKDANVAELTKNQITTYYNHYYSNGI